MVTQHNESIKEALSNVLKIRLKARNELLELKGETYNAEWAAESFGECASVGQRYVKPSRHGGS